MVARQAGVIAGLPLAVATFQKLSPDISIEAHVRDGARGCRGRARADDFGPGARGADRRAHRAEFRRPAVRHRHAHRRLCAPYRRHQNAHLLHAQDHAGPARAGEICRALRRRLQPPLRARRRDPDQGQPHRGRRRRPRRCWSAPARMPAISSRSRSRSIRSTNCARCSTPVSPMSCCSTTWISRR